MPFTLPTFNLLCNIWKQHNFLTGVPPAGAPAYGGIPCNLQYGSKKGLAAARLGMWLLTPKATDINAPWAYVGKVAGQGDAVEVPMGSGRFYSVIFVDDVSFGFPTQHRASVIVSGGFFANALGYTDPTPWPSAVPPVGPGTPGLTCATAGNLPLAAPYTGAIAVGLQNWWTFMANAGQQYTIAVADNVGNLNATNAFTGTCLIPLNVGAILFYPGTIVLNFVAATPVLVQVIANIIGAGSNYTITLTSP